MKASAAAHRCAIFAGPLVLIAVGSSRLRNCQTQRCPRQDGRQHASTKVSFDLVRTKKRTHAHTHTHTPMLDVTLAHALGLPASFYQHGIVWCTGMHRFQPAYAHYSLRLHVFCHHVWYAHAYMYARGMRTCSRALRKASLHQGGEARSSPRYCSEPVSVRYFAWVPCLRNQMAPA